MSSVALGILATRTWGHCPPVVADRSCERQAAHHCGTEAGGRTFPCSSEAMGRVTRIVSGSSTTCTSPTAVHCVSSSVADIVGTVTMILFNLHLSTDLCTTAATNAGDILSKSSDSSVSSRKCVDETQTQPMRHNVATNAPTGPVTADQTDWPRACTLESLSWMLLKITSNSLWGAHECQCAIPQCLIGVECAQ